MAFLCGQLLGIEEDSLQLETVKELTIQVDPNTFYQTIEHFGASDAWSCQFVGNWPDEKKASIADLLFSQNLEENGDPKGIGLSLWRFNIGAGSAGQGKKSGIKDEWRRAESFMEPNGSYNWGKQQGQMWFAQAAKERGVDKLLLFSNSPPVTMTRNGKAYADKGKSNLAADKLEAFADFLATVNEGIEEQGVKVDYISPVNEPQWDWSDGGQEGTPFWNHEIREIVKALDQKLDNKNLDTQIDIAEAGQINYLYEEGDKPGRADQIRDFFKSGSENYLGNLSHLSHTISGHSYFTTSPFAASLEKRKKLAAVVKQVSGLRFWMSEYCILGDNEGEIIGKGRDLGIDPALYMARVIHSDLAVAQATAWHWWLAISPYDYKDGLVYIDYNKKDGRYVDSKMLWALGNFSRFIRPGYKRIGMQLPGNPKPDPDFLFSGYKKPDTGEMVFVLINSSVEEINLRLEKDNQSLKGLNAYLTSAEEDLAFIELEANKPIQVPSRSIMTIITLNP